MRRLVQLALCFLAALLAFSGATAQTPTTREVIDSLDTPWEILWGPDNWIWMTERGGRVSRIDPVSGNRNVLIDIAEVYENGESGLLGMVLHPSFADTPHVFLVYTYQEGGGIKEKLVRYTYTGTTLTSPVTLLAGIPGNTTHDGSRLIITPDRKLFMTVGEAQNQPAAQSHTSIGGKIIRMNLDGSVPADNPWSTGTYPQNLIWSSGHRNPQGLVLAPNGILYSSEHGPSNDDEINIIKRGRNFGWPTVMGFCDTQAEQKLCTDSNVAEPIQVWSPTIATCGLDYYDNPAVPRWRNSLFLVNLKGSSLMQLKLAQDGLSIDSITTYFQGTYGRLRDICISPDGKIYISTSNRDGRGNPKVDDDKIIEVSMPAATTDGDLVSAVVNRSDLRPGEALTVTYTTTGTFGAGNMFIAELSSPTGSFASPMILEPMSQSAGRVQTRIPCAMEPGTGYLVRVRSTSPLDTAIVLVQLTVRPSPTITVTSAGTTTFCQGDSVAVSAPAGYVRYRWIAEEGGAARDGRAIYLSTGGRYHVNVEDSLGCVRSSPSFQVTVRPTPTPVITATGNMLDAGAGYASYQWSNGDQGRVITATTSGTYTVRVTDTAGCSGTSAPFDFTAAAVRELADGTGSVDVRLLPNPVRSRLTAEIALGRASAATVVISDLTGARVRQLRIAEISDRHRVEISTEGLPAGTYLFHIDAGERSWSGTFVKE